MNSKLVQGTRSTDSQDPRIGEGCPPWVMCDIDNPIGGSGHSGGNDCDKGIVKMTDWYLIAGYNVSFVYEKQQGDSNYNVKGVTSGLSGAHLGVSWTHENAMMSTKQGKISFRVNGKQHYNIIVEGIGTVFTQDVQISGEYDPCSGNYTIKVK